MAHIHTNPGEHDLTASAFIVRDDFAKPRLMLHMHKKLGVLLQPGGHEAYRHIICVRCTCGSKLTAIRRGV